MFQHIKGDDWDNFQNHQSTKPIHQEMLTTHNKGTWKQYPNASHKKNLLRLVSITD